MDSHSDMAVWQWFLPTHRSLFGKRTHSTCFGPLQHNNALCQHQRAQFYSLPELCPSSPIDLVFYRCSINPSIWSSWERIQLPCTPYKKLTFNLCTCPTKNKDHSEIVFLKPSCQPTYQREYWKRSLHNLLLYWHCLFLSSSRMTI